MDAYSSINIYEETQLDCWASFSDSEEDCFEIDLLLEDMDISEDLLGDIEIYM